MSLPIHLSVDSGGRPRARWSGPGPASPLTVQFLETDLAGDLSYVDRILDEGRRVVSEGSTAPAWKSAGNAFALVVGPEETVVSPLFPEEMRETVTLKTGDFLDLVGRWRGLIEEPHTSAKGRRPKRR